jgi:hypothetical protein
LSPRDGKMFHGFTKKSNYFAFGFVLCRGVKCLQLGDVALAYVVQARLSITRIKYSRD